MKILEAHVIERFKVHILFEDGISGSIDLSDLAGKGVFSTWTQPGVFEKMTLTEWGTLEWPGSLDLCSDSLYLRLTKRSPKEVFLLSKQELAYA